MAELKVWTLDDYPTHWPVDAGSVVVAENEEEAKQLIAAILVRRGVKIGDFMGFSVIEFPITKKARMKDRANAGS